ncbi:pyridoxine 5'-phosphate synthase [Ruficoccus amylovorans]|uniref:Pyridoxine 5'-phosphate synthase n=1 Tax=Ruficoccus amylovorans TaxID=1804625 RepID=A0A842HA04_9BACT|nr:pyridoxine 5'-phosphate synthase [Ruficoccus amylovorans]MBC2593135.1 pyridoxine 5'-phosphate synthase [Ruficoccus amylovorans]
MQSQQILLGVNIDHSATVRQARYREHALDRGRMVEPDPVEIALHAQRAGADGITMHLREDRRHIQDSDVRLMRDMIQVPLNLEMACTQEMLDIALEVRPDVVLLVPEGRQEVTTEGGLDVIGGRDNICTMVSHLGAVGVETSLFIDPDPEQVKTAAQTGCAYVELHTGAFASAFYESREAARYELERLRIAADIAANAGLKVNAGHGINYVNIRMVRELPHLHEMNIGHSIISRALYTGITEAVREMKALMNGVLR